MIPRISPKGRSFSGLAKYLMHDSDGTTNERVDWAHTLNLANDHVPSAVNEMLWTTRDAEILKMEAGVRAGGRSTTNCVKHVSLNWAPGEEPTREHMIETTEDFLRHMKWQEHQAVLVAHNDKAYRHVHIMLNAVHPETGLRLDDNFEKVRAQEWALAYERQHGLHCENRLKDAREREDAPTRPAWMAFRGAQNNFEETEKLRATQPIPQNEIPETERDWQSEEWSALKTIQRDERQSHFAHGKQAFSETRQAVYREVREEFRERWSDYYTSVRDGSDPDASKETKAKLLAEQKTLLEQRRDDACGKLREKREADYRNLLDGQLDKRQHLRARQEAGLSSIELIDRFRVDRSDNAPRGATPSTDTRDSNSKDHWAEYAPRPKTTSAKVSNNGRLKSGATVAVDLAAGIADLFGDFFIHISGGQPRLPEQPREAAPKEPDLFALAAEDVRQRTVREATLQEDREREDRARSRQ